MKERKILYILFIFLLPFKLISGQIINSYIKVNTVLNQEDFNVDSVIVDGIPAAFSDGDTVIIIQMNGAEFGENRTAQVSNINNAGKYEFIIINNINGSTIVFNSVLARNYDNGQAIQMVKVSTRENMVLSGNYTADPWNGETGGVFALMVHDTLFMNGTIDVSGQGFRGGDPTSDNFIDDCVNATALYYTSNADDSAGLKGEGPVLKGYNKMRGIGRVLNGGGGGNGKFSGGAGGGNYGSGGSGGRVAEDCIALADNLAIGGLLNVPATYYKNESNLIFMGGGGGTSTSNAANPATKGGDGGGIVIIIAQHLVANGGSISADGESVNGVATAGGSGGGGGGIVLLDINGFSGNNLTVTAKGGKGGDTPEVSGNYAGSGGGGGGGIIWHYGNTLSSAIQVGLDGGDFGEAGFTYNGTGGESGVVLSGLQTPLTGFLFNIMPEGQKICGGQTPEPIIASEPKGGDGDFTFLWQQSTDLNNWTTATGTTDEQNYQPPALFDTTYYRRVVESSLSSNPSIDISDTSVVVSIHVLPAIENNLITGKDTICNNSQPGSISGLQPAGGDDSYAFTWQQSNNLQDWTTALSESEALNALQLPSLSQTLHVRRQIISGEVCSSISDTVTITVLSDISQNQISENQVLCIQQQPIPLNGQAPSGGDGAYTYIWQSSTGFAWGNASGAHQQQNYQPPVLNDTTSYRRIVLSGSDDVCIDTSNVVDITVLPDVTNNSITPGTQTVCENSSADLLVGSNPSGGDRSYSYTWLFSNDNSSFVQLTGEAGDDYDPGIMGASTWYKRVVLSGAGQVCKDTSLTVFVEVTPAITENIILKDTTYCQGQDPVELSGSIPGGAEGTGSYQFQWLVSNDNQNYNEITPTATGRNYNPPSLTTSQWFRRKVESGVCTDTSSAVLITILPPIGNNLIEDAPVVQACFNVAPPLLGGSEPTGGEEGQYRYQWLRLDNNNTWADVAASGQGQDYQAEALSESAFYRRVVLSGLNNTCTDTSLQVEINVNPLPTAILTSYTDTLCQGESHELSFTLTGASPWQVTYTTEIGNNSETLLQGDAQIDVSPISSADYSIVEVQDANNCLATDIGGEVKLIVYQVPQPNAGNNDSVCGPAVSLNATPSVGEGVWTASLPVSYDVPTDAKATATLENDSTLSVIFTWTEKNWNCIAADQTEVQFYERPEPADAGSDTILFFSETTVLDAISPTVGTGSWSVLSGQGIFVNENDPQTLVDELGFGANVFLWTIQNGVCEATADSIEVERNDVVLTTGFSPDGNNINDYFIIPGLEAADEGKVIIFNRWGKIIYAPDNYVENPWNGQDENGNDVPEDTYYIIIELKKGDFTDRKNSFIVLRRAN